MNQLEFSLTHDDLVKLGVFDGLPPEVQVKKDLDFDPEQLHEIKLEGACNTTDSLVMQQVAVNIRRGLPQAKPCPPILQTKALLVCGGPSLDIPEVKQELIREYWSGGAVACVNGAYEWCIANNIKPSAMIMIDAREFNSRFVEQDVPDCKYFLASQCHPTTFEKCRERETYIWHMLTAADPELELLDAYYFKNHAPVTLGTSVGVRALSLLRMLGFLRIEVFGLDSCWIGEKHHAYAQEENNYDGLIKVWLRPEGRDDLAKSFLCSPWHCQQAYDFQELIRERGDIFQLNVHGPGLIAEIMRTGAKLEPEGV